MKGTKLFVLLLLAIAMTLPTSVQAGEPHATKKLFPVTIVDDLHTRVQITQQPKRILSLDPRDTETLFALGLEKRVVGDGGQYVEGAAGYSRPFHFPSEWPSKWGRDYPIRAKALPHIEGGFGTTPFDLEKIESLTPDLILSLNSDRPTLQKMRDLGLKVVVLDPANLQGIYHDIQLVGRATGATNQAATVTARMKSQIASVRKKLAGVRTRPRVYYEIDATNPTAPYTAGPGTFIDETIKLAGARNVADSITSPGCPGTGCYPQLSLETLVKLDPQIILLGDAPYGTKVADVKSRTGWSTIAAIQSGRIYPFDDELISRAGPRISIGLLKLARRTHPERFGSRSPTGLSTLGTARESDSPET